MTDRDDKGQSVTGSQGSMRMPASKNQDQSQSNMVKPSKEDYELMFELLWPYRDLFGLIFRESVKEIAKEYAARKAK